MKYELQLIYGFKQYFIGMLPIIIVNELILKYRYFIEFKDLV